MTRGMIEAFVKIWLIVSLMIFFKKNYFFTDIKNQKPIERLWFITPHLVQIVLDESMFASL